MDIQGLHKLIDEWAVAQRVAPNAEEVPEPPPRELPKDLRVVRTSTSQDRVYLLDEIKKTRQWVTRPEILDGLGFIMEDVIKIDDAELAKYEQGVAIYKLDNA